MRTLLVLGFGYERIIEPFRVEFVTGLAHPRGSHARDISRRDASRVEQKFAVGRARRARIEDAAGLIGIAVGLEYETQAFHSRGERTGFSGPRAPFR